MSFVNIVSSTVYITNAIVAYCCNKIVYALIAFVLVITSWCYHSDTSNIYTKNIDKTVVNIYILYGFYQICLKKVSIENMFSYLIIVISLSLSIFLYYYGSCTDSFCFHPEFGDWYHAIMHGISSLGHHGILNLK